MFKMLGIYMVLNHCLADPLLEGLYGAHGGNKVTVCTAQGRACEGAAWGRYWVVTRDSCLQGANASDIDIWREDVNCSEAHEAKKRLSHNKAVVRYKPSNMDNVALLRMNWPYAEDPLSNQTKGDLQTKLELYISEIDKPHKNIVNSEMYYTYQYAKNHTSPVKIFLLTVILPSAAFMVFFFFVIFFTGSKKGRVNYRPLLPDINN